MMNNFISSKPTREKVFREAVWVRISDWLEDELGYSDDKAMDTTFVIWDKIEEDIKEWEDEESILIDLGHRPSNCQWMLTKNEIIIK